MIYTYRCNTCRKIFEKELDTRLVGLGFHETPKCRCGSSDTVKIIVPTSIIFRGDGFTKSSKESE